ncbi:Cgl0159 family (beta/alpha)8-fold protein [Actinomadura rupiterrae]|uniref:Cgl0159 family (beta/alpha)8-fold protein n=1 Tax=Actinomadura rupiterrae TaxID=559627 RepID=UPI0020A24EBE|nr:hypothetical protein [Actinomadura rupiterrae]MCP2338170.1 DhnA family fructose-bisphosphate aldolase class Ia [Actinomadura rupiterrae]
MLASTGWAERVAGLTAVRVRSPEAVAERAAARVRRTRPVGESGRLMIVAADHPGRGVLGVRADPHAMADRSDYLERVCTALSRPGVDGVLGTPDIIDDLLLLGVLDGLVVLGSMNRGGLAGAAFETDDRFTGYDAAAVAEARLDGGKMLLRIDEADPATAPMLEACARAVSDLAGRGLMAVVEPFMARSEGGGLRNVLTPDAMVRAVSVASALGTTSARTWLKVPVVPEMDRVMAATTLPALILGGEVSGDLQDVLAGWRRALQPPNVRGLIVGRSLLYPPGGDVRAAVDAAVEVVDTTVRPL